MRYGENPHQQAAFYVERQSAEASIATAQPAAGQRAVLQQHRRHRCRPGVRQELRRRPACVIVKHANPCGVARRNSTRGLRARLQHRPGIRLRRHHRLSTANWMRHRAGHRRPPVRRGHHRAAVIATPPRSSRQEKRPRARVRRMGERRRRLDFKRVNGGLLCRMPTWLLTDD